MKNSRLPPVVIDNHQNQNLQFQTNRVSQSQDIRQQPNVGPKLGLNGPNFGPKNFV